MFKILYRRKKLIIITTLMFTFVSATYNFLALYNKLTMTLSLNYPAAEQGLNPDGTRFNVFEIKSDEVLDRAIANFNSVGITVDELRDRIDIYAKSSNKTVERVKTANISGKDFKYIPNEYSISYSQKDKFSKNHTYDMLKALATAYKSVFEEKHTEKNVALKFDKASFEDYKHYEYVEIADLLTDKLETMERYISKRNGENATFRADETGQTFENLLVMVQSLKNIEVEKYRAFVVSSALAKNRGAYIKKLIYSVDTMTIDRSKTISETNFVRGAIAKYDPNITGVAFIPSLDTNNEFYMNRTKTGLDYLTSTAYNAGINTEKLTKEIDKCNYLINIFSNTSITDEENKRLAQTAEDMLIKLGDRFTEIEAIALKTDGEYMLYKTKDYIKFTIPQNSILNSKEIKSILLFSILGFILACGWVLLKQLIPGRSRRLV